MKHAAFPTSSSWYHLSAGIAMVQLRGLPGEASLPVSDLLSKHKVSSINVPWLSLFFWVQATAMLMMLACTIIWGCFGSMATWSSSCCRSAACRSDRIHEPPAVSEHYMQSALLCTGFLGRFPGLCLPPFVAEDLDCACYLSLVKLLGMVFEGVCMWTFQIDRLGHDDLFESHHERL